MLGYRVVIDAAFVGNPFVGIVAPLIVFQQNAHRAPPVGIGALTSNVRSDAWPMFRNKSVVDRTSPRFAPDRSGVQIIADDLVDGRGVEFPARLPDHAVRVELLGDPVV